MPIEVKSFTSQADETKEMPNARVESVNVLGQRVMKLTLAPEWKWSRDIKPIVGTSSCQATHTGIIVEGTIHCVCVMTALRRHIPKVMPTRFLPIMMPGALGGHGRWSMNLLAFGGSKNVFI